MGGTGGLVRGLAVRGDGLVHTLCFAGGRVGVLGTLICFLDCGQ